MLTPPTDDLELHHTDWYDLLMYWKPSIWFKSSLLALSASLFACQQAWCDDMKLRPQDEIQLRPQVELPSVNSSRSASSVKPPQNSKKRSESSETITTSEAVKSANSDFNTHRLGLMQRKHFKVSPAPTGATRADNPAAMRSDPDAINRLDTINVNQSTSTKADNGNKNPNTTSASANNNPNITSAKSNNNSNSASSNSNTNPNSRSSNSSSNPNSTSGNLPVDTSYGAGTNDGIPVNTPKLESLIHVNEYLNPFTLDADRSSSISLKQALDVGIDRNLDLAISLSQTKQSKFEYYSSLGKFLPDPTAGFSEYFARGHIGLPFNIFGGAAGAATGATTGTIAGTAINGVKSSGRDTTVTVNRPFEVMHAGADFYAYRGGSVLFGALQARNNYRARTQGERATLSDTLLSIAQNYYNLVLAETVLQIRVDAVKTSEEQLRRNQARFKAGLATNLEVLQSKTQLSRDRQALIDQQINRRSAAITLSDTLNLNLGEDLKPTTNIVQKIRLVDPRLSVGQVLQMAIDHRPELKQYEQLRRAAKKGLILAAADLQPNVLLSGQAYGIGPPSNVEALGVFSVSANWRLRGIGTVDSMQVVKAKWEARQAALQSQKELQTVCSQVRNAYLQILDKEKNIVETSSEVTSATEELRLAELRKSSGLGLNLDILNAQRDLTQARVDKAQAIINYNIAQCQLLHDTGLISITSLTSGRLLNKSDL